MVWRGTEKDREREGNKLNYNSLSTKSPYMYNHARIVTKYSATIHAIFNIMSNKKVRGFGRSHLSNVHVSDRQYLMGMIE